MAYRTPNIKEGPGHGGDLVGKATRVKEAVVRGATRANKYAVESLLESLKNTEVGSRKGTAIRAADWRQRTDQDGEDRLECL